MPRLLVAAILVIAAVFAWRYFNAAQPPAGTAPGAPWAGPAPFFWLRARGKNVRFVTVLEPGDALLLHSDGLVEAHGADRQMFGFERMRSAVGQRDGGTDLIDYLMEELRRHTGSKWEQEDDITLVALTRSGGAGEHIAKRRGGSAEFKEHRAYAPGDDIRDLDWRVFAKTDRYYIKQYIEETNLRATIVLDCSGSMKYRGDQAATVAGKKVSKFEYAQYLAASLAYLMIKQQDAVGLVTFDDRIQSYIKAASRPSQVRLPLCLIAVSRSTQPCRSPLSCHRNAGSPPRPT